MRLALSSISLCDHIGESFKFRVTWNSDYACDISKTYFLVFPAGPLWDSMTQQQQAHALINGEVG